jgi:predicted TIM-barrel fold metal-dependent hydrolase
VLGDVPIIDAVIHGFDFDQSNMLNMPPGRIHAQAHLAKVSMAPEYQRYVMSEEQYEKKHTAEELVSACFAEAQTDIAVYHIVRRIGYMNSGEWSPLDVAVKMREIAGPERVRIMAGLSDPFDTERSKDELDQMIEEVGVCGLKFYPWDWDARKGKLRKFLLDDENLAYPLIEHLRSRGIKALAVHKAMGSIISAFGVSDLDQAVIDFPDMDFEIVHAGWAFMDDTAILAQHRNVYLNLEGTASLLSVAPRRFAEILGRFLQRGGGAPNAEDRILWATGVMAVHPRPLVEKFWEFQMPEDLVEGVGYPEVTDEMKRKILGGNYARKNGLDLDEAIAKIPNDEMRQRQNAGDYAQPWVAVAPRDTPAVIPDAALAGTRTADRDA